MRSEIDVNESHAKNINEENVQYEERIVALVLNSTSTACGIAIYVDNTDSLTFDTLPVNLEGIEEILFNLKTIYNPTLFLLHPKFCLNPPLLDAILCSPIDGSTNYYRYVSPKSASWKVDAALEAMCHRLVIRDFHSEDNTTGTKTNFSYHLLSSSVDMQNQDMLSAASALLGHMLTAGLSVAEGKVTVSHLLPLQQTACMRTDQDTLRALGIFVQENHPNTLRARGRSKEGFSLFTLLDRTRSSPGRTRLREWISRPFCDLTQITNRLNGVALMARTSNLDWACNISKHLRKLHDVPALLTRVKKAEGKYPDWTLLLSSCSSLVAITESVMNFVASSPQQHQSSLPAADMSSRERSEDASFLSQLFQGVHIQEMLTSLRQLEQIIDLAESLKQEQLVVKAGYDATLDSLRDVYARLDGILTRAVQDILTSYPEINRAQVEYVPQIGFLVSISNEEVNTITAINATMQQQSIDPVFQFVYSEGTLNKYKSEVTFELDASIGDIRHAIQDRQRSLMISAENALLDCEGCWRLAAFAVASIDAVMSLGIVAREREFVRPTMTTEKIIAIKSGRHPLQELTVETFVTNDTYLDAQRNIAAITGPNSSGKSVYLKQVGLLVYMAHIGSFVPCERAVIGLCDRLLTRISTVESSSIPQSSFTLDLCQMSRLLKAHTSQSLCLIDEFGRGTSPVDGIALLASAIEHFTTSDKRCRCMFVLNYTEVITPGLLAEQVLSHVLCFRMSTHCSLQEGDVSDKETGAVPLYRLEVGIAPTAMGIACAADAGVPDAIVERARLVRQCIQNSTPISPLPMAHDKTQIFKIAKNALILRSFLQIQDWMDESQASDAQLETLQSMLKDALADQLLQT